MLLCLFFAVFAIFLPYFLLKGRAERLYFKIVLFGTNAVLLGLTLFSFQISRESVYLLLLYYLLSALIILVNFWLVVFDCIKRKSLKEIRYFLPIALSALLSFGMLKIDLSERISLLFEFGAYKTELDDYVFNGKKSEKISEFGKYSGIVWTSAGYYSVIVYDKNNNLDLLFKQSRSQSQSTGRNEDFEQSFANSLDSVLKIQDNYFRCKFHTEDLFK